MICLVAVKSDSDNPMNPHLLLSLFASLRYSSLLIVLTSITTQFATTDVQHPFVRSCIHLTARSSPRPTIEGSTVAFEQITLTFTGRGSTDDNCHAPRHRTNYEVVQLRKDQDVAGWTEIKDKRARIDLTDRTELVTEIRPASARRHTARATTKHAQNNLRWRWSTLTISYCRSKGLREEPSYLLRERAAAAEK